MERSNSCIANASVGTDGVGCGVDSPIRWIDRFPRPSRPTHDAAFVIDPDANNVEIVFRGAR